jgi:hypothetical protein
VLRRVRSALLVPVTIAAVVGILAFAVWPRQPSASSYARTHVQELFVDNALKRTGTVHACTSVGPGNAPGEMIWACSVAGRTCLRTFKFAVSHEYGTAPYNDQAARATDDPCT